MRLIRTARFLRSLLPNRLSGAAVPPRGRAARGKPAGAGATGGLTPRRSPSNASPSPQYALVLRFPQQLLRLGPEPAEFLRDRLLLPHPLHRAVEQRAGPALVAEL